MRHLRLILLFTSTAIVPSTALAQSALPGASALPDIIVTATQDPLAERMAASAGGGAVVAGQSLPESANLTMSRALASVPGVVVQDFFGGNDQPRIQIRGSGLQQNPVERGILMLRNGLPLNRADGSYIVGFGNPGDAQAIEVYRGYLANRLGATVLGGAINLISPTGRSAAGLTASLAGGSFGQFTGSGQLGLANADGDALLHADFTRRAGYRQHNDSRRLNLGGNAGVRLNDNIRARLFANYAELDFDIPGPLPLAILRETPRIVWDGPKVTPNGAVFPGPNVVRDRPGRTARQMQAGTRVSGVFDAHVVDLLFGVTHTDDSFRFPISAGIRDTRGDDLTFVARYAYRPDETAALPLFEANAQYATGSADRGYALYLAGERGAEFGRNRLTANTLSLNAGLHLPLAAELTLSPSLSWSRATRDNADLYRGATRPTAAYNPANPMMALPAGAVPTVANSYARRYSAWSPAIALSYAPAAGQTLFAAFSRSFEPPTHDDLLATVNGTPNSSAGRPNPPMPFFPAAAFVTPDLKAQAASTVEAGWRGRAGAFGWDALLYHSWVTNELLSLRDEAGSSLGAANAPRTRHLGAELGVNAQLLPTLRAALAYTWQDFRFRDDPVRGDNRLGGAPRHWLHVAVDWQPLVQASLSANLRWVPEKTPVDNLNTLYNAAYAVADLRGEVRLRAGVTAFGEVTNLFDRLYAASTLIVDQARPDQAAFLPGDGRAVAGGIRVRF